METLPDTLVVRILSKVGDGLMLLDVLPLVCQRWRRLCHDHAAWAEVDVDCDGMDESDTESEDSDDSDAPPELSVKDALRLILRAPAMRVLRINWDFGDGHLPAVMSALRRSRVVVQNAFEVSQEVWTDSCHDSRVAVLDTLWRSRHSLKSASVCLYLEEDLDNDVDSDADDSNATTRASHTGPLADRQGRTALQVLASLKQLRWLDLAGSSNYPYAGELKNALPHLQDLLINEGSFAEGVLPEQLLLDLIRGATSLRSLDLGSDYGRPAVPFLEMVGADHDFRHTMTPALLESIAQCSGLRSLDGPDELAAVLGSLPHLEILAINVHPREERGDVAATLGRVLRQCAASTAPLKSVQLFVDDVYKEEDPEHTQWAEEQKRKCDSLVEEFNASRPEANLAFYWE